LAEETLREANVCNLVRRWLVYLAVLAVCGLIAPAPGLAKEKGQSNLNSGRALTTKKQATLVDSDGYRLVSPNSTLRCAQTLRSTLDCKE
jgi:hypothetical protein